MTLVEEKSGGYDTAAKFDWKILKNGRALCEITTISTRKLREKQSYLARGDFSVSETNFHIIGNVPKNAEWRKKPGVFKEVEKKSGGYFRLIFQMEEKSGGG